MVRWTWLATVTPRVIGWLWHLELRFIRHKASKPVGPAGVGSDLIHLLLLMVFTASVQQIRHLIWRWANRCWRR